MYCSSQFMGTFFSYSCSLSVKVVEGGGFSNYPATIGYDTTGQHLGSADEARSSQTDCACHSSPNNARKLK